MRAACGMGRGEGLRRRSTHPASDRFRYWGCGPGSRYKSATGMVRCHAALNANRGVERSHSGPPCRWDGWRCNDRFRRESREFCCSRIAPHNSEPGTALVAFAIARVVKIEAPCALQEIATHGSHVADFPGRGSTCQQGLRKHRIAFSESGDCWRLRNCGPLP